MSDETLESKQDAQTAPTGDVSAEGSTLVEGESKTTIEPTVDYKALLEQEKTKLKRAEEKIVKLKKTKDKEDDRVSDDEEIEDKISSLVERRISGLEGKIRQELIESEVDTELSLLSSDPDKRALIKHVYENRIPKSGHSIAAIREDLAFAQLWVDKDRFIKTNKELSEALKAKSTLDTAPNFSASTRSSSKEEEQYSPEELALLKRYGVKK